MFRRHDEAIRVGVRLLIAAALAGLLVLLLQGRAHSAELPTDGPVEMLLDSSGLGEGSPLEEASAILKRERRGRFEAAFREVLDLAWKAGSRRSVRGLLSGGKDLLRVMRKLRARSPGERRALALLDAEVRAGTEDEQLRSIHSKLLQREREAVERGRLSQVRKAIRDGALVRARARLGSLRRRVEDGPGMGKLEAELSELEAREAEARESLLRVADLASASSAPVLAALLLGDVERVCSTDPRETDLVDSERSLLCAAGLYRAGDPEAARLQLEPVAGDDGASARTARRWLQDSNLYPDELFKQARHRYRIRTVLGWLGGRQLEARGLDLSSSGVRAWRAVASPLNLALGLPVRMIRNRAPDGGELRTAASLYLERRPQGTEARSARSLLESTAPGAHERRLDALFRDGMLDLPRARTPYAPIFVRPIAITAALLRRQGRESPAGGLLEHLGEADALILLPSTGRPLSEHESELSSPEAHRLLDELARAMEDGTARAATVSEASAIEALRRLDRAARSAPALRLRLWFAQRSGRVSDAVLALMEGNPARLERVTLRRGKDDFGLERPLLAPKIPRGLIVLDRGRPLHGRLYATVDLDGGPRIGMEATFQGALLRVELSGGGPHASLRVPFGSLLGIGRWMPLEASLGISLAGITVSPRIDSDPYRADAR
ncbi:MAG: hypothetical protein V3T14_06305 [Myxococcota bacterium]